MRTPLFRSLRQLVLDLRRAKVADVPTEAVREARAARASDGLSRRQWLVGSAVAAGALALPRGARATPSDAKIAIVGGGMAGMACANVLAKRGIGFTLFEANNRIGGRMFSNASGYWDDDQVTEWGGELIDTGHKTMRRLARNFGLPLDDLLAAEAPGATETYKVFGSYYAKADADRDFRAMFGAVENDEAAAGYPTLWNDFTAAGQALDRMSVHDWIRTRVPGGHSSPLGKVLDLAYTIEYAADTADQSALNLLYLLAYQPRPGKFAAFGESDERFHIRGGNDQLPRAIAASLPDGTVRMGWSLQRVARRPDGRTRLTFEVAGQTREDTFDWVVLCLPFAILRDLEYGQAGFDDRKKKAIRELGRGHSGKTQLQFRDRIWAGTGPWPGVANGSTYCDNGYQASWEPTRGQPGRAGILNLFTGGAATDALNANVAFSTAENPRARQDATTGLALVSQVFPGLQWNGRSTSSVWAKNPFAKHSYAYFKVGQYTAFAGHEGARQGGVLFAGDHTSQDFQGFMEGAASEGERAGKDLLQLL
jgi:monoamine oxidase